MAVAGLAVLAGTAMGPTAFSVFIQPMSEDLGWSRSLISGALSLGTIAGAAAAPLAGALVDRYGTRVMLTLTGLGLGVSMAGVGLSQSPLAFYLFYGLGRMLDMGVILVGSSAAVANWFIRRRGRAMGLAMMGAAIGLIVLVPAAQLIMLVSGWRTAWLVFAVVAVFLLTPAAWLVLRRRPEDIGLLPDGVQDTETERRGDAEKGSLPVSPRHRVPASGPSPRPRVQQETHWPLSEALRTASFWLLLAATSLGLMAFAGVSTHQIPILIENGIEPIVAAGLVSLHAVAWAVGNVIWGFASERLTVRYSLAAVYLLAGVAVVLLLNASTVLVALAYAVLYGLMVGGQETVESVVWADYYGRFSLGAIRGFSRPFLLVANASGTLLAGVVYDVVGGYGPVLVAFALLSALSGALMLLARPPRRRSSPPVG